MINTLTLESPPGSLGAEEEKLIIEAARQDVDAFARLYHAYVQTIYHYLYSRVGQARTAEDLTSQVFLEALESLPRYRHRGFFRAWLFSIARHRMLNYHQRRPPEVGIEAVEDLPTPGADPLSQVIHGEEIAGLIRAIQGLKEDDRELLRLRYVAELSFSEIGMLLKRREGAVKKQLYRLLARLKSQMEDPRES